MTKLLTLLVAVLFSINSFSQDTTSVSQENIKPKKDKKQLNKWQDYLVVGINYNRFIGNGANESLGQKDISLGYDLGLYKTFAISNTFAFATGLNLNGFNINSDIIPLYNKTSENTVFWTIPEATSVKKNKMSLTYIDVPLEIRIRTKFKKTESSLEEENTTTTDNNYFKIALGCKIGYLLNSHTKYYGDYLGTDENLIAEKIKTKTYDIKYLEEIRYGVYGRIGYGRISAYYYYSLVDIFKADKGPQVQPFTAGLNLSF